MEKGLLLPGDTIGIIAPSRPIENIRKDQTAFKAVHGLLIMLIVGSIIF
jgi:muramoyltetrapeptide carboxypeptidase LdcA involved in peptidoglycan recycling